MGRKRWENLRRVEKKEQESQMIDPRSKRAFYVVLKGGLGVRCESRYLLSTVSSHERKRPTEASKVSSIKTIFNLPHL